MSDLEIVSASIRFDPGEGPGRNALACSPEGDTSIRIRVRNNGPGLSREATLRVNYVSGVRRGESDCGSGAVCVNGGCQFGVPPCFDRCSIPALLSGQTHDVQIRLVRPSDLEMFGTATVQANTE